MDFKTVSVTKFPLDLTWEAMVAHLPEVAKNVEELESITEKDREQLPNGDIRIVNEWRSRPKLPGFILKYIKPDMLSWNDTGYWTQKENIVRWEIQSHYFKENMQCKGATSFEPAMGGKGCRLTFEGSLHWNAKLISMGLGFLDDTVSRAAETALAQMIPANFKKLTDALNTFIMSMPKK